MGSVNSLKIKHPIQSSVHVGVLGDPHIPAYAWTVDRVLDEGTVFLFTGTETTSQSKALPLVSGTSILSLSLRTFNTWSTRLRLYQLSLESCYPGKLELQEPCDFLYERLSASQPTKSTQSLPQPREVQPREMDQGCPRWCPLKKFIMDANASNLSDSRYGYDFVVATTQASINSTLLGYLRHNPQPENYLCFLANQNGDPSSMISLEQLLALTDNVNPFDIPDGTACNDPRILALTRARFIIGNKIQMGLPPGILPRDLPPVVTLGSSATNVRFRMFCSQFTVIQNTPPGGFNQSGNWNVWGQDPGTPWRVETNVDLVIKDLDRELNTPYLNKHPDIKERLWNQLNNLSGTAFSLQQLLFDLENAVLQSVPRFPGVPPGSEAQSALQRSFVSLWSASVKDHGFPLVSIVAIPEAKDESQLHLTSFERHVNPLQGDNGKVIPYPTSLQQEATTLNYLCAADGDSQPEAIGFGWNWVSEADIDSKSGVIAINRNTFAKYLKQLLLSYVQRCCMYPEIILTSDTIKSRLKLDSNPPVVELLPTGSRTLHFSYSGHSKKETSIAGMDGTSTYTCDIDCSGQTITVAQHLVVHAILWHTGRTAEADVIDMTMTAVYRLNPDSNGHLNMTREDESSSTRDTGKDLDFGWCNSIVPWSGLGKKLSDQIRLTKEMVTELPLAQLPTFIFPGAETLTYAMARFSDHHDLKTRD
ncbi:hypothetical protein BDV24DRAFT_160329 [Aspergillus arachidicola]|uniref:Uncharacterized protein n=1 Tax=Aspergillus arachidicola TaxID=656916 RepID=A0A5N6YJF3_9EURO|nr:hypothetical protein BDV24DRAFT_160329 [Aspergillus arachidicola]